jgi:hypothetical protein
MSARSPRRNFMNRTITGAVLVTLLLTTQLAEAWLTPVEHFEPPQAVQFKTASVCHFPGATGTLDYYGIFAVFQVERLTGGFADELWYLRVDGLSTWHEYGLLVQSTRIATEKVISHVDCTTDGRQTAYVTWDRSDDPFDRDNARWAAVDVYGEVGMPFEVPSCGGASWGTGIAYHRGGIAISSSGRGACRYCSFVWPDVSDPSEVVTGYYWFDGQTGYVSDVVWNGDNGYLMVHIVDGDLTHGHYLGATVVAPDGTTIDAFQHHEPSWTESDYSAIYIAFSDHAQNLEGTFLVQTDRITFWLTKDGFLAGPAVPVGPWELYPTCEFWGSAKHIANTYSQRGIQTQHQEWGVLPSPPENAYLLPERPLVPIACGSSTDFTDAEVLLVRRAHDSFLGQHRLYFNFEPQD